MKITVYTSHMDHPVVPMLRQWCKVQGKSHAVRFVHKKKTIGSGDILFLISCNELINSEIRSRFKKTLVVHASDLPKGRGWSPHIWAILSGKNNITVSLLEALDKVDSGDVLKKMVIKLQGHELYDEINAAIFKTTEQLMAWTVKNFSTIKGIQQKGKPTYYRKRTPSDSEINPYQSIVSQFNSLRVADPQRFPAFFDYKGHRYQILLKKTQSS